MDASSVTAGFSTSLALLTSCNISVPQRSERTLKISSKASKLWPDLFAKSSCSCFSTGAFCEQKGRKIRKVDGSSTLKFRTFLTKFRHLLRLWCDGQLPWQDMRDLGLDHDSPLTRNLHFLFIFHVTDHTQDSEHPEQPSKGAQELATEEPTCALPSLLCHQLSVYEVLHRHTATSCTKSSLYTFIFMTSLHVLRRNSMLFMDPLFGMGFFLMVVSCLFKV